MKSAKDRAIELMKLAAHYIEDNTDQSEVIEYDDAECDGVCLVEDLRAAAEQMEAE